MKKTALLISAMLFAFVAMTGCTDVNDDDTGVNKYDVNNYDVNNRPGMFDVNNRRLNNNNDLLPNRLPNGDSPLRNDPEYNDRDNDVIDADRDDLIIDDEDITNPTPNRRR